MQQGSVKLLPPRATSRVEWEILIGLQSYYMNSEVNHLLCKDAERFAKLRESVNKIGDAARDESHWLYGDKVHQRLTYLHLQEKALQWAKEWIEKTARKIADKKQYPAPYTGTEYGL